MTIPKHVTDLSREDFEEIARAVNPMMGVGVSITNEGNRLRFSLDLDQLRRLLWAFNRNGGFTATEEELSGISFDPQPSNNN